MNSRLFHEEKDDHRYLSRVEILKCMILPRVWQLVHMTRRKRR